MTDWRDIQVRPARSKRRDVSNIALLLGTVMLVVLGIPLYLFGFIVQFFFLGRGDDWQRLLIWVGVSLAATFLVGIVGRSPWSYRTIARSPLSWAIIAGLVGALLWATFGIDSTRPLRALPESRLSYPGATVMNQWDTPAEGVGDAPNHASLQWRYSTVDPYTDVVAFYGSTLSTAGWTGPLTYGLGDDTAFRWKREDGHAFQIIVPEDLTASGEFRVALYGPEQ